MSDFTVAAFCKITSGAAQLYSWVGRGTRVRSLCTRPSWLQEETQSQVHVLKDRRDHHTVHLWNICSEHWHLFELLGTQLDPELTLTAHCSNLPEWALPTLTTSDCTLSLIHSSHRGRLWVSPVRHHFRSLHCKLAASVRHALPRDPTVTGCFL